MRSPRLPRHPHRALADVIRYTTATTGAPTITSRPESAPDSPINGGSLLPLSVWSSSSSSHSRSGSHTSFFGWRGRQPRRRTFRILRPASARTIKEPSTPAGLKLQLTRVNVIKRQRLSRGLLVAFEISLKAVTKEDFEFQSLHTEKAASHARPEISPTGIVGEEG